MPRRKAHRKPATPPSAFAQAWDGLRTPSNPPPTVSARWLLTAAGASIVAAAICAWGALCLLFWQGSWQLLYHPSSAVSRTPASAGMAFDSVSFATTETGEPRLKGWWIAADSQANASRYTVLYLHGQDGNLSNTVDELVLLHGVGVNVLAFDYRGYGQSQFQRPSEARWREDANWALQYLTATRHIPAGTIILDGRGLGADLALEIAAQHPELAGVVLRSPLEAPVDAIFNDPRARLVPAHLLVRDRYDLNAPAAALRIPSLWIAEWPSPESGSHAGHADAYERAPARKMRIWLPSTSGAWQDLASALSRWLGDLHP
jgi:hypothetical protein